jgi:hypothetical protein
MYVWVNAMQLFLNFDRQIILSQLNTTNTTASAYMFSMKTLYPGGV